MCDLALHSGAGKRMVCGQCSPGSPSSPTRMVPSPRDCCRRSHRQRLVRTRPRMSVHAALMLSADSRHMITGARSLDQCAGLHLPGGGEQKRSGLVTVEDIVRSHWAEYGRNYYTRYDCAHCFRQNVWLWYLPQQSTCERS